jgi:hypothetical protein
MSDAEVDSITDQGMEMGVEATDRCVAPRGEGTGDLFTCDKAPLLDPGEDSKENW